MTWTDAVSTAISRSGAAALSPRRGPLILMYHAIGGSDGVDPAAFAEHLDLLSSRHRVVPLAESVVALGQPEAVNLASITFDDGYLDFAELAVPALQARSLHATLFVPASRLGGENDWEPPSIPRRRILSAAELRELDPDTVEIGAHGATHCRLRDLDPADLEREIFRPRRVIEDACGRPVRFFAYPYGQADDFDLAAERAVESAGFLAACSTRFGRGSRCTDRFSLRRVGIAPHDRPETVERKLQGAYDWFSLKEAMGLRIRRWKARHRV
jgi:peptidoglycan/xylan/chitin deacetylase (PgdA/CDA1 family)